MGKAYHKDTPGGEDEACYNEAHATLSEAMQTKYRKVMRDEAARLGRSLPIVVDEKPVPKPTPQ
jgi:hypothetical protein